MKKTKLITLAVISCLFFSFTGCGQSDVKNITATAETFLQAATDCDIETASSTCLNTVLSDIGLDALSTEHVENIIYTNMQIEKEALSENSQNAVKDFATYYAGNLIQNFSISDASVSDDIGLVNATITTYSMDALSSLSSETFKTNLTNLMTQYKEENKSELISVSLNQGQEAMMNKIFDDLMPDIMDLMKQSYSGYTPEEVKIILTLEKTEDTWMITKASFAE